MGGKIMVKNNENAENTENDKNRNVQILLKGEQQNENKCKYARLARYNPSIKVCVRTYMNLISSIIPCLPSTFFGGKISC